MLSSIDVPAVQAAPRIGVPSRQVRSVSEAPESNQLQVLSERVNKGR
jgi:hypothetical protein